MRSKSRKRVFLHGLILTLLFAGTFYLLLKDQDLDSIIGSIAGAKWRYLFLGLAAVFLFVVSESVILHYMMNQFGTKNRFLSCVKYSFVGFFVSYITPSSTGGQPAQVYYMMKDGLPMSVTTLILLVVTVFYKLVLVLIGFWVMIFNHGFIVDFMGDMSFWFYLGMALNVAVIAGILLLIFEPNLIRKMVMGTNRLLVRIHLLKENSKRAKRLMDSADRYHECALFLKKNPKVVVNSFLITVFQRGCLFFITFLVYKALGFKEYGALDIMILQAAISISVEMLPVPGGIGASEGLFVSVFGPIFGNLVMTGVLLSRGLSYYVLLIAGALVTAYAHIQVVRKEKRNQNDEGTK